MFTKFINILKHLLIPRYLKYKVSKKYKIVEEFFLDENSIVLDFGAHIGEVSEYFLKKKCKVYAYEPNKSCFAQLKKLTKYKNFSCFNIGLSDKKESKKLYLNNNKFFSYLSQGSSIFEEKYTNKKNYEDCEFDTIDNILKNYEYVHLIKIDIEGSEYKIIDDLIKNINKFEICLIETHEKKYKFFQKMHLEFIDKIDKSGFKEKIRLNWI